MRHIIGVVALSTVFCLGLAGQAQKNWKDRAEYDLYESITKEQNPTTKLGLLHSWKEKYPASEYKDMRAALIMDTYRRLGKGKEMMEAAKEVVSLDPKNLSGLYWMNLLTISLKDTSPAALDQGDKAAKDLLASLDETFAPAKKPAQVTEEAWKKSRSDAEKTAYRTLGWTAMQRNQYAEAEQDFLKALAIDPGDGEVSSWLGTVTLRQKTPEKQSAALYHFARAAVYDGPGALPEAARKQYLAYLEKTYTNFHGSRDGLDQILAAAKTTPLPPADFRIKSSYEIAAEKEEEFKKTNPQLALWMSVKKELAGPNGVQYFDSSVKDAMIPPGGEGMPTMLKGRVISMKPANRPKEVVLAISPENTVGEVTLKFETPLHGKAEPGTELEFKGRAAEFSQDPFNLTFEVDPADLSGWPVKAPAPAKPPAKKARKK